MIARVHCTAAANITVAPSVSRCGNPGITTYQIGFEALAGKIDIDVADIIAAIRKYPANRVEILIAGVTEALETRPNAAGIGLALQMLKAVASALDTTEIEEIDHAH